MRPFAVALAALLALTAPAVAQSPAQYPDPPPTGDEPAPAPTPVPTPAPPPTPPKPQAIEPPAATTVAATDVSPPDRGPVDARSDVVREPLPPAAETVPPAPQTAAAPADQPSPHPILEAVRSRLADRRVGRDATPDERAAVTTTYERLNGPLWTSPEGLTVRARMILDELGRAEDWGLPAAELVPAGLPTAGFASTEAAADAEVRLSLALLKYARYARGGRIPEPSKQLATYIDRSPQLVPPADVLAAIAVSSEPDVALRGYNPQHPAFEALRKAYVAQRAAKSAGATSIASGPKLKPGDRHPHVAVIRRLLSPAATLDAGSDPEVYDAALATAVKAFQDAGGFKPDGLIGGTTRSALEALRPPAVRDLLVNMEQWRWMPPDMGDVHIHVNIPEFTVRVMQGGRAIHTERVVTGLVTNQTPVFSDRMRTIVLRPDWVLPESIKVREAIPSLLRGGGMFYSSGLRIKKGQRPVEPRSIDWSRADQRHYTFYQPPGPTNALGVVKFLFPNKHAVYLHDTPSKHLFANPQRAYSHGCVRVRNPVKLAEVLLGIDKGWTPGEVRDQIETGPDDNKVALTKPIPVHLTYFTVTADEQGRLSSHKDIYGHGKRIALALDGRFDEIDVPPDHLAPVEDREFESRIAAAYAERRQREAGGFGGGGPDPVGNFFQQLFGGGL